MAKGRGDHSRVQLTAAGRRKRAMDSATGLTRPSGPAGTGSRNTRFVRAFADALRDILQHEHHGRGHAA